MIADANNETEIVRRLADDPWELTERMTTTAIETWTLFVGTLSKPASNTETEQNDTHRRHNGYRDQQGDGSDRRACGEWRGHTRRVDDCRE